MRAGERVLTVAAVVGTGLLAAPTEMAGEPFS